MPRSEGEPHQSEPLPKRLLEAGVAVGGVGIVLSLVSRIHTFLIPAIELAAGSFIIKKAAYG